MRKPNVSEAAAQFRLLTSAVQRDAEGGGGGAAAASPYAALCALAVARCEQSMQRNVPEAEALLAAGALQCGMHACMQQRKAEEKEKKRREQREGTRKVETHRGCAEIGTRHNTGKTSQELVKRLSRKHMKDSMKGLIEVVAQLYTNPT
jgi:hypothetical protein